MTCLKVVCKEVEGLPQEVSGKPGPPLGMSRPLQLPFVFFCDGELVPARQRPVFSCSLPSPCFLSWGMEQAWLVAPSPCLLLSVGPRTGVGGGPGYTQ